MRNFRNSLCSNLFWSRFFTGFYSGVGQFNTSFPLLANNATSQSVAQVATIGSNNWLHRNGTKAKII